MTAADFQPQQVRQQSALDIFQREARRDRDGKLAVYKLPTDDGGGTFEVAGINEKYDPEMAQKLKTLVNQGKQSDAEKEAQDYIAKQTDAVQSWGASAPVEYFLRDTAFNRGTTGAAKILQAALGVKTDGQVGPKTKAALHDAQADPQELLQKLRQARETFERDEKKRDEKSDLWKGLVNRWDDVTSKALAMAEPSETAPDTILAQANIYDKGAT